MERAATERAATERAAMERAAMERAAACCVGGDELGRERAFLWRCAHTEEICSLLNMKETHPAEVHGYMETHRQTHRQTNRPMGRQLGRQTDYMD